MFSASANMAEKELNKVFFIFLEGSIRSRMYNYSIFVLISMVNCVKDSSKELNACRLGDIMYARLAWGALDSGVFSPSDDWADRFEVFGEFSLIF